jgi:uncharacterized protein (DUF1697 family)
MKTPPVKYIALLRGINVSGRNKVPMAELRPLCGKLGWGNVQTYIQSGNVVFSATGNSKALELELERAVERRFGVSVPVIVRAAADWPAYVNGNPFPEASETHPSAVMMLLSKAPPKSDAAARLLERATHGERIIAVGDALWVYFKDGVADSKLSPALFDRLAGSPVTARNWRTVLKLDELQREA